MTEQNDALATYCRERKSRIDHELERIVSSMVHDDPRTKTFGESLSHAVLQGGKRIRPILGIAVYELFGNELDDVLAPLCTVELIHTGSLLLDDLPSMDNAELRRGAKTNHVLFGEAVTILTSASLWIETFTLLARVSPEKAPELIGILGEQIGTSGLIRGQLLDLELFNQVTSVSELEENYRLKTGVLFVVSALIGATLGGATREERSQIEQFATCFGIAFQIRDDIVDATHTTEESGKDAEKDSENSKPNYVSLLGIEGAREALSRKVDEAEAHLAELGKQSTILASLTNELRNV